MSGAFSFYLIFFLVIGSSIGVIVAPRMYLALLSLFILVSSSSLLYFGLNAKYMAVFQFILCGLILSVSIFILLKKIGRLNLKLKLVPVGKLITGVFFVVLFGGLSCLYFNQEFNNSLYSIFNYISGKSDDVVNFAAHTFPLHLVVLLVLVSAIVIRVFFSRQSEDI